MNAEALTGKVLGTCTLQQLIGRGGMGAVFLAQQSRPRRQVAVKVLLPITTLLPNQLAAFLERFRRETDTAASLEHPNIVPVHEYGEQDGLAYLVMPYIKGGTLRDILEKEGALPLPKVVTYLEQMAAALDFAHERGVIHRDIKPANMLITPEGRLLLTDFGLVKLAAAEQDALSRLSEAGIPMGTPDYMAPEQVIGGGIDARADLYSLGVILYQMLTGSVPFKGELPMQVALQHVHTPPLSPRSLRPDLPAAAQQVVLRALAKKPADRYMHAQDLVSAFRLTLEAAGVQLGDAAGSTSAFANLSDRLAASRSRSLFDPVWRTATPAAQDQPAAQPVKRFARNDIIGKTSMTIPSLSGLLTEAIPAILPGENARPSAPTGSNTPLPTMSAPSSAQPPKNATPFPANPLMHRQSLEARPFAPPAPPSVSTPLSSTERAPSASSQTPPAFLPPVRLPSSRKTSLLGLAAAETASAPPAPRPVSSAFAHPAPPAAGPAQPVWEYSPAPSDQAVPPAPLPSLALSEQAAGKTGVEQQDFPQPASASLLRPGATRQLTTTQLGMPEAGNTSALMVPVGEENGSGTTSVMKLTQPVKIVKVPVAGQPGRYVTGLLPVVSSKPEPAPPAPPSPIKLKAGALQERLKPYKKLLALIAAVVLVFCSSGIFLLARSHNDQSLQMQAAATPDRAATATMSANATAQANIILADSLQDNSHNWPVSSNGPQFYVFKDGAYHLSTNDTHPAIALLPDDNLPGTLVYTLSFYEVQGDHTSINNLFGMVIRYSTQQKNGRTATTFYCFEVLQLQNGGQYEFRKYDDSYGINVYPWTRLWYRPFGNEYHFGQGSANKNTVQVSMSGDQFRFVVNGKQLGQAQDNSLDRGQIGMLVNQQGTEVAFSNLQLTYK